MDPCIHGEEPLDQKNADGRTAFQLYIVDKEWYKYSQVFLQLQDTRFYTSCIHTYKQTLKMH